MTTGADIVTGALLNINAYSPGQPLSPQVGAVGISALNDLLESLSTDQAFVFTQVENIFNWNPGQYKYTVGNPQVGFFLGTVTIASNIITNVVPPTGLLAGTSVLNASTLTDLAGAFPAGTYVTAVGATTVTMSANALFSPPSVDSINYTVPGNIGIARPLRIRSGYTRITSGAGAGLDYPFDCQTSTERYNEIGFKNVAGPWPYLAMYQPTYPYGTLWIYPNPQGGGQAHLFTDVILSDVTLTQTFDMPQGYSRALKKLLALELSPIFGKEPSGQLRMQAKEAKEYIKSLNASPQTTLRYDADLVYSRHTDASFIMDGGFR